jgi:hypothetical protein
MLMYSTILLLLSSCFFHFASLPHILVACMSTILLRYYFTPRRRDSESCKANFAAEVLIFAPLRDVPDLLIKVSLNFAEYHSSFSQRY